MVRGVAGAGPGRGNRPGCRGGGRPHAGPLPPRGRRAARGAPAVRAGAAGRRAAPRMTSHGGGEVPGLAAGRLWAASAFPYLASGLFGAQVLANPGIATVAVDEGWRMHADPELIANWSPAQLGRVHVHNVSHLLLAHGELTLSADFTPDNSFFWIRGSEAII